MELPESIEFQEWLEDFGTSLTNEELHGILEKREPANWKQTRQMAGTILAIRDFGAILVEMIENQEVSDEVLKKSLIYQLFKKSVEKHP